MDKDEYAAKAAIMSGEHLRPILKLLIDRNLPTELLELGFANKSFVVDISEEIMAHPNLKISSLIKVARKELEVPGWVYRMCARQLLFKSRHRELNDYCKQFLDLDETPNYPSSWLVKLLGIEDIPVYTHLR